MKNYYYKVENDTKGTGFRVYNQPLEILPENYTEITKEEYENSPYVKSQLDFINQEKAKGEIKNQITQLKKQLADTDYQAIKYAEGQLTEQEYAPIKSQRQGWRDEINQLEARL